MRRVLTGVLLIMGCALFPGGAYAQLDLTPGGGSLPDASSWWAGTCDLLDDDNVEHGGPADTPEFPMHCVDTGTFGVASEAAVQTAPPVWRLAPVPSAAGHPDATATFTIREASVDHTLPSSVPRNVIVDLPAGVVGNVRSVPQCSQADFLASPVQCHPSTQVGLFRFKGVNPLGAGSVRTWFHPLYNLVARPGVTAELGIADAGNNAPIRLFAKARTDGDFGVKTGAKNLPTAVPIIQQSLTVWGVPWAASHDRHRVPQGWIGVLQADGQTIGFPPDGLDCSPDGRGQAACPVSYDPSWGPIRPYFTNPTECSGQRLTTALAIDSYEAPGPFTSGGDPDLSHSNWRAFESAAPEVQECGDVPFAPDMSILPTSRAADSASGLSVDFQIPQNDDPPSEVAANPNDVAGAPAHWKSAAGRATAHLDKAVVTLPPGVSVNPSAASGLAGCSEADIGVTDTTSNPKRFNDVDPLNGDASDGGECPSGSVIGTAVVNTPLLADPLPGEVVLGQPKPEDVPGIGDPLSARLYLVLRNQERALIAKIFGTTTTNPATGQLTAVFDKNPRLPFESMQLEFKGGERGMVALPQRCGNGQSWAATFTPWTAAHGAGGVPVADGGSFNIVENCAFGFAPALHAGMNSRSARGSGTFSFRFSRRDGEQWFKALTAELPSGLLASVKGFPLCTSAQAAAGACPAASRLGSVDAGAGSGAPFFLERKGDAYLTQGYKGCAYGMLVRVPVEAGPFRGDVALDPIVLRQALCVDPSTAQVRAVSDPFPTIWHGIPLRVREVTVTVDRPRFMLNPSGCSQRHVVAALTSAEGTVSSPSSPFRASGCAALPFKPRLALRLTGRKQLKTGKHPGVRAVVRQKGVGEAGIERAQVRLPKSLALDPDNAQALCEFDEGTKPDIEKRCPKGSIVGRARAVSPLLNRPLVGNVYFVKNIRIDPTTGNEIRTLPMLIVALRGEIAVNLRGESAVKGKRLVNTFDAVPDAPVSRFNLNIRGGKNGILAVTRTRKARIDLCRARRQVAEADFDGHNGRRKDFDVVLRKPCARKGKSRKGADRRAAERRRATNRTTKNRQKGTDA